MARISVLFIMLAVLIAGCGGPAPDSSATPPAASAAPGQPSAADAAKQGYTIAVLPKGLVHQFWLTVKEGAEAAGKETNATIVWKGPDKETEVDKQINIVTDMINRKVDAIVMAACHEEALVDVVKRAVDAGIPVVTIDSGVKSDLPVSFIATDNIAGAKTASDILAKLIGNEGKVGLIPFVAGAATSQLREQGFKEGIAQYPNIQLVSTRYSESDVAKGMAVTQDMVTANPDLKGIFAANENGAVGAAQALKSAGKAGQVKLVAFDASDEEIKALQDGSIQALVVQNPYKMGYEGVKTAVAQLQGKPVEKRIDTGVVTVTMENFNDPDVQKLLYPGK